jgi:ABC-type lipoprotein export system ATPase subunit
MNSKGSIWRKWDLHIHTPASFEWRGKRFYDQSPEEKRDTCKAIMDRMNETDVDAFGVMDYWTFDGYFALRDYLQANPSATSKAIFPGLEFRLEAPTDYRLNTHVLFSNTVSKETLQNFLARLCIGGPNGVPPTKENFIEIAKQYDAGKLRHHGLTAADKADDGKMYKLGLQTAVVTRESLEKALELIPEELRLIVQPYDTNDGLEDLDWKRHPFDDSYLMKLAHIFETRDQIHVDLFLGNGHATKPNVGAEFIDNLGGYAKPCVSGSDAHEIAKYGVYPSDRITWLKAQPSFAGLQQVTHEPQLRCFIGVKPPKTDHVEKNPTKYITGISLEKVDVSLEEVWFDGVTLELNPGLIAIIGNKGSGKSALADILALAGNSHCPEMEFLNDQRFRKGGLKAAHFAAKLTWADGTENRVTLDQESDTEQPERVRYLPQQFIENLCNEIASGNETNFERELKKVIFSHVPEEKRLGKASLDELLDYTVESHRKAISQFQGKVADTNATIVTIEREISEETIKSYRSALSLKQSELDAHEKTKPEVAQPPNENQTAPEAKKAMEDLANAQVELSQINQNLNDLKTERTGTVAKNALLTRLGGHVTNFETAYRDFVSETKKEFSDAGFDVEKLVKLEVDRQPLVAATKMATDRLAAIAGLINGTDAAVGLEQRCTNAKAKLDGLQAMLAAPQKKYQEDLAKLAQWTARKAELVGTAEKPDTIEHLKARIENAEKSLPRQLNDLKEQRRQLVRDIHGELLAVRQVHQDLYSPVQQVASTNDFAKEALHLRFDAFLAPSQFEENFLDFIHRNKKGNFYGDEESKDSLRELFNNRDFNKTEDVVSFLDGIMIALTLVDRAGVAETLTIQSQLKASKKVADFYNYLFQLTYLEPRYTLKLGDKDISQLSPGEKGALLLVFYLLLDQEEIPIIIDQPEQNLDNESVVTLLVDCIRRARARRQVIIVTHNPNLAVVCDADQIVYSRIDKAHGHRITYTAGAIEDYPINKLAVDVLEGTYKAFSNRGRKYHKPRPESNIARTAGPEEIAAEGKA